MFIWFISLGLMCVPRFVFSVDQIQTCSKEGCSLHNILPRVLQSMSQSGEDKGSSSENKVSQIFNSMKEACILGDNSDEESGPRSSQTGWDTLLSEAFDEANQSFAQVNQKRRSLAFQFFRDRLVMQKTIALDCLVAPNIHHMNVLFKRTRVIGQLQRLPQSFASDRLQLQEESPT